MVGGKRTDRGGKERGAAVGQLRKELVRGRAYTVRKPDSSQLIVVPVPVYARLLECICAAG
jgi:hypothetical protein